MGKEKEKNKKKSDKKKKEKEKIDKEKKEREPQDWKIAISGHLDNVIAAYEKIVNIFRDIDNYILKDADSREDFIERVKKNISDLPEPSQNVFLSFLDSLP